jgi:hypothetical protein
VGFHPGYRTAKDAVAFLEEQEQIRQFVPLHGGRQHGLRFHPPYTWRLWEAGGFKYDASLGFAEQEGFKSGLCFPYRPFDLLENRVMDVWELPLTVMDCTLDRYRGLQAGEIRSVLAGLFETTRRWHGVFVLLWHNTYFGRDNVGEYHDELVGLVRQALEQGAFVGTAIDVIQIWENWLRR